MCKSVQYLKNFYQRGNQTSQSVIPLWLFIGLALIAYLLPWVNHPTASFRLDAFDLAEWSSLHPLMRISEPVLIASLLLRSLPAILALLVSLNAPKRRFTLITWWLSLFFVMLTAIALLPPVDFFTDANLRGDVNYRQQFQLAIITVLGGIIGFSGIFYRLRNFLNIILGIIGIISSYWAMSEVFSILDWSGTRIEVTVGAGAVLMGITLSALIGYNLWKIKWMMTNNDITH